MMRAIEELTSKDVMQTGVKTISPDSSLMDAWRKIRKHQVTALPVMDDNARCVGILSDTDLQQFEDRANPHSPHNRLRDKALASTCVGELMTHRVVSVRTSTLLSEVAQTLERLGLRHVPVLGDSDQLEGVISLSDLRAGRSGP